MPNHIGPYLVRGTTGLPIQGALEGVHRDTQRRVLIERLSSSRRLDSEDPKEARARVGVLCGVSHPALWNFEEAIYSGHDAFLVFEWPLGMTLSQRLDGLPGRKLELDDAMRIAQSVLSSVAFLHQHRIDKGNVSVDDVLVSGEQIKLSTAGFVRHLFDRPDRSRSDRFFDPCQDLYGVGAVLFEMLSGQPPHLPDTDGSAMGGISKAGIGTLSPDTPIAIVEVVSVALRKEPRERFQTAAEFQAALNEAAAGFLPLPRVPSAVPEEVVADFSVEVRHPSQDASGVESPSDSRWHGWLLAFAGVCLVLIVVGIFKTQKLPPPPLTLVPAAERSESQPQDKARSGKGWQTVPPPSPVVRSPIVRLSAEPSPEEPSRSPEKALATAQVPEPEVNATQLEIDRIRAEIRQGLGSADADLSIEKFDAVEERLDRLSAQALRYPDELSPEISSIREFRKHLSQTQISLHAREREEELQQAAWERRLREIQDLIKGGRFPEAINLASSLGRDPAAPSAVAAQAQQLSVQATDELKKVWGDTQLGPTKNTIRKPPIRIERSSK